MNVKWINAPDRVQRYTFKIVFFIIVGIATINLAQSQDIIFLIDGSEINSKVYEITPEFIKYKIFDDLDGPLRNIHIKDVFKIKYENGRQEMFNNQFIEKENVTEQQELSQTDTSLNYS